MQVLKKHGGIMNQKKKCVMYSILSATLFGISSVIASILFRNNNIRPEWLVGTRMFWSGLILLLLLFVRGQSIFQIFKRKVDALLLICFGIFGVLLAQSSFFLSVYYGDAASATVLQSLGPTVILILLTVKMRVWPSRREIITILLALIGVFFLVTNGNLNHFSVPLSALIWGVISAFGVAGYTLIPKPLLSSQSPLVVVAWGLFIGGFAENLINPVWKVPQGLSFTEIILIGVVTFGGTLLAYSLYIASLCHLKSTVASLLGTLEPLTATLLSVLVLQLHLKLFQVIGIILILLTVLLVSWPTKQVNIKSS